LWEGISGAPGPKNLRGDLPFKAVSRAKTAGERCPSRRWHAFSGVGRIDAVFTIGAAAENAKTAAGAGSRVFVVAGKPQKGAGEAT